ncbi:MAG: DUF1573 domain-containing protein [Planctomycetes bacterium]|jgi:hypothetical protein|nr:DUF1573 domain-containing protein [Planctomycetota bacterium]
MRRLGFALALVLLSSANLHAQSAWADKLFGADKTHDFGSVARGSQLKYDFKMTNIWKVPLQITDVRVSCGCLTATPSTKLLQPNETGLLHVHMDGRKFNGPKTIRVYVTVGPKYISTATLIVSANASGDVVFTPNDLDFGNLHRGETPTKAFSFEYKGSMVNWRVTEIVKNANAPFELKVEPLPGAVPGRGFRVFATIKPGPATGAFKQDVLLKTNDPINPVLTFQIVGNVQAGLTVSPSPVVLKGLKVGEAQTRKVIVRASKPFRVTKVEGQADGVSVAIPERQDMTVVLTVTVNPKQPGELRKTLMIHTDLGAESTPLVIEASVEP